MNPECKLIGVDGNIYSLMSEASACLKRNDMRDEAKEMVNRIPKEAESYNHALRIIGEYVTIVWC